MSTLKNESTCSSPHDLSSSACIETSTTDESEEDEGSSDVSVDELPKSGELCYKPVFTLRDEFLYCCDCSEEFPGDCPEHGPLTVVHNAPVNTSKVESDVTNLRAIESAPAQVYIEDDSVRARLKIPARTRFGPLEGKKVPVDEATPNYSWLIQKGGKGDHCIDASDPSNSNWMRYVNTALQFGQHNLEAIQHHGSIYFTSTRLIEPKEQLLVWSGNKPGNSARQGKTIDIADILETTILETPANFKSEEQCHCQVPCECSKGVEDKEFFICDVCDKRFLRLDDLSQHMKSGCQINSSPGSSKEARRSPCIKNVSSLVSKKHFTDPKRTMTQQLQDKAKRFSCSQCTKVFTRRKDVQRHLRVHTGEKPYACTVCGMQFSQKSYLMPHSRSHTGEKPFACPECGKQFASRFNLNRHLPFHSRKINEKIYSCQQCDLKFASQSDLSDHIRRHNGEKPFACLLCGKEFAYRSQLQVHSRCHTGEKPYACRICVKKFAHHSDLSAHVRTHTGEKPYACSQCSKQFAHKSNYNRHIRSHTVDKPHNCSQCYRIFPDQATLTSHKLSHSREKPFQCAECGKEFSYRSNLRLHLRSHTGERPYACKRCDKRFYHKTHLTDHERIHNGEKPFACSVCGEQFTLKPNLTRHLLTHTKEKPFPCPHCDKGFSRNSHLADHLKKHI